MLVGCAATTGLAPTDARTAMTNNMDSLDEFTTLAPSSPLVFCCAERLSRRNEFGEVQQLAPRSSGCQSGKHEVVSLHVGLVAGEASFVLRLVHGLPVNKRTGRNPSHPSRHFFSLVDHDLKRGGRAGNEGSLELTRRDALPRQASQGSHRPGTEACHPDTPSLTRHSLECPEARRSLLRGTARSIPTGGILREF